MKNVVFALSLGISLISTSYAASSNVADDSTNNIESREAQARKTWRESMERTQASGGECFHASYPDNKWTKVDCTDADPARELPRPVTMTVGDGKDDAASVTGLLTSSVGTFPSAQISTETNVNAAFTIQLNSNTMTGSTACKGMAKCQGWQQFVYSSGQAKAYIQYWLLNYTEHCPSGWDSVGGNSCFKNSSAVKVPNPGISELASMKMSGSASSVSDKLVFTTEKDAYSITAPDTVVDLSKGWKNSEFNVVGDGGGSAVDFGAGTSVTVQVAVTGTGASALKCKTGAGTTGETNNLSLKACKVVGGTSPYIQFVESN